MAKPILANQVRKCVGVAFCLAVILPAAFLALRIVQGLPYLYCCAQESSWLAAKDEADLDGRMRVFHTKHGISPSASSWGRGHELRPGERMVRYLVFGLEPLDAVFDRDTRVVAIYTSYE